MLSASAQSVKKLPTLWSLLLTLAAMLAGLGLNRSFIDANILHKDSWAAEQYPLSVNTRLPWGSDTLLRHDSRCLRKEMYLQIIFTVSVVV